MRSSLTLFTTKFVSILCAATLAVGLMPATGFATEDTAPEEGVTSLPVGEIINEEMPLDTVVAQSEATTSYFLAQTLESTRTIPMVSASVPLDEGANAEEESGSADDSVDASFTLASYENDSAVSAESTVVGSFTTNGLTYAVEPGGETVAVVAVDYNKLPEPCIENNAIVIPSVVTADDVDYYSVTRIADQSFPNFNIEDKSIDVVGIPASVISIGENAFTDFATLQYIVVEEDNPAYSSYDGVLYNADQTSLLLVPEGRLGAVRVAPSVTSVDPEVFSHCPSVDTLVTDPASAAFQLLQGRALYDANGNKFKINVSNEAVFPESSITWNEIMFSMDGQTDESGADDHSSVDFKAQLRFNAAPDVTIPDNWEYVQTFTEADWDGAADDMLLKQYSTGDVIGLMFASNHSDKSIGIGRIYSSSFQTSFNWTVPLTHFDNDSTSTGAYHGVNRSAANGSNSANSSVWFRIKYKKGFGLYVHCYHNAGSSQLFFAQEINGTKVAIPYCDSITLLKRTSGVAIKTAGSEFGASLKTEQNYVNYAVIFSGTSNIVLDLNGGSCEGVDSSTPFAAQSPYALPTPTKANHTFLGWSTDDSSAVTAVKDKTSLNGDYYTAGSQFYINKDVTFKANWKLDTIICTWNSNGGSAVDNTTAICSDTATVPMPSGDNPTKAGYTFGGWWTDPSGGTQVTSSTKLPDSNPTYYAHWDANTITCTWNSNGGSAVGNTTATYGPTATVPMPNSNPTKTGYAFAGWWTAAEGGTQVTSSTTLPTSNPTYYAHWTVEGYTITWEMKGVGSQPTGAKTTYKYEDTDYTLPTPTAVAGYTFGGWYENENCTGTAVTKLLNHSTGNKTFWAKWTGNTITITWNSEGGSAVGSTSATYSFTEKVPMPSSKPTYPGRTFAGWYTQAEGGTLITEDSALPTSNAEYHAHWTTDEYTITWKMKDHGSVPSGAKGTYGYDDADYALPEPAHVPGWTFQGWYDNEACTGTAVSVLSTHSEGDKTFWAKWTQDEYTVTFDLTPQDGRPQAVQPSALPVLTWHYGEDLSKVTFPTSNRDGGFYRNGYTFDGWAYKQGDTFVKVYDAASGKGVGSYEHESGTILYAQWTPITYTVNFHWNYVGGGTYTYEVKYDDELAFTKGESERESNKDYKLVGWFTEDGTQELVFVDGKAHFAPVFSTTAPRVIDYYAKWKAPEPITITLHTGAHASFSDGAKERTGTLEYSKSVNLRDPERGLDPKPDTGYDFIGWRRAVLDEDGEPLKDGNGDYVVEEGSYVTTIGPYETKDMHLIAHISANACSVTLLPGVEDGKSVPRNEVTYQGWNHPGDVYEFDISHFTGENGQVSSLVLPNATRAGYAFSGWRLANSEDKPVIGLTIDPKEIATSTTRNRTYVAVWAPKDFTVLFVPNRSDLTQEQAKQEEQKTTVSLKGSVTMPYPATRAEGDVTIANGKASSIFSGWTLAATPSLSDDIHAAKTSVSVRDIASYADASDTIVFYAQWNRAISVACPLYATIAIDPESRDIVASDNMALTSYYGSSTSTPELEVVSVRYDKLKGEQESIFDATLATSGVFDKGKVYLTVYAGCDKPDLRHDAEYVAPSLRIDLGSSLIIPKESTDGSVQTLKGATGFDKRFSSTGDSLSLYYGLEFGQGVDPRAFVDTLPDNDAGGANGWSSDSYPIARIYYTVGLA